MPKAKKLTKKELDYYKSILLELRTKIVGDLQHLESSSLNASKEAATEEQADIVDAAAEIFEREFTIGLASNEQKILNQIDVALRKIEDKTYGICEKYGTAIPKKRLEAMPYATLSVKAQTELEQERDL